MIALQSDEERAGGQKIPLYEQIYAAIRRDIEEGSITCGEKLPSTRLLAANLSVSRFTVDLAYGQLVSEGYIQARAGSGFFVCDLSDLPVGVHAQQPPQKPLREAIRARIDFSPFAVDAAHFPYKLWKKRGREVFDGDRELLEAGDAAGDLRLRALLASYLYRARGVRCVPEQILIGAGNEYLLLLLMQLLDKPGVAMESPTYVQAYEVLHRAGAAVYPMPMDRDGLCLPPQGCCPAKAVYVMPSHQFPMGTVMPLRRRQALLEWAAREGRYIIEDDHDSEFRYVGKPIPSLQGRDREERVIYLGTFSKSISPALRMSYMVLPLHLSRRFQEQLGFYSPTVSTWQQRLVCRFMEAGDFERHLNRMRRVYKAKHDFLLRELRTRPWVRGIGGENAGLHLVVRVAAKLSEEELLAAALESGVQLYGLGRYYIGSGAADEPCGGKTVRPEGEWRSEGTGEPEGEWRSEGTGEPEAVCRVKDSGQQVCAPKRKNDSRAGVGDPTLVLGFGGLTEEEIAEGLGVLDRILTG